jgi:Uma2 family endonuclease
MSAQPQTLLTVDQYLAFEETSDSKHEYLAGYVTALAGGNEQHTIICGNVYATLHSQVRHRSCIVYTSDMQVKVEKTGLFTYPDVAVVCGEPIYTTPKRTVLLNPTVIIEVLSPSTERYDRGKKFHHYRALDSLQEYILIAQDTTSIDHYLRQPDNLWLLSAVDDATATMTLPSIQCLLQLTDVYDKVQLQTDAEDRVVDEDDERE